MDYHQAESSSMLPQIIIINTTLDTLSNGWFSVFSNWKFCCLMLVFKTSSIWQSYVGCYFILAMLSVHWQTIVRYVEVFYRCASFKKDLSLQIENLFSFYTSGLIPGWCLFKKLRHSFVGYIFVEDGGLEAMHLRLHEGTYINHHITSVLPIVDEHYLLKR